MDAKTKVLVVEDESSIRQGLEDVFAYHGYDVEAFSDGESALAHAAENGPFDIAVLDVMLPGIDGFELCGRLRSLRASVPILLLTARGSEDDVVAGFRAGADDYVTKPFSIRELVMRVQALLRRSGPTESSAEPIAFGRWIVSPSTLRAESNGDVRDLTPRELQLVAVFAREKGRIVSRRSLLDEVWGMSHTDEIETRTVDMHIAKLRKKIDPDAELLETVRGAGYRFDG